MRPLGAQQRMAGADSIATRSFGGCDTCRTRRVKCDEARPTCLLCRTTGLACRGYGKNIFFTSGDVDGEGFRFRRLLFTEAERRDMSQWLTSSVPPALLSKQISCLEEQCENAPPGHNIDIRRGPFGVFRGKQARQLDLLEPGAELEPEPELDWCRDIDFSDFDHAGHAAAKPVFNGDGTTQYWSPFLTSSLLEEPMQDMLHSISDACDVADTTSTDMMIRENRGQTTESQELDFCVANSSSFNTTTTIPNDPFLSSMLNGSFSSFNVSEYMPVAANASTPIPGDAVFLLKHYTTNVVNFITPFGHAKTPWHTLFIPHVKTCLATLTMGEEMSNASLATFFGTLAISAASLSRKQQSQSSIWLEPAKMYERQAHKHCHAMLKTAYDVPKVAKYKSILMALLTLVHLYTVTGRRKCVEFYFIEAEKFIRLRGLNRKKSRKVRLLHHCYAFQRVFYESLCIGNESPHRRQVQKALQSSESIIYSKDDVSFHASRWHNLPQELLISKTQEEGENDLHLERPGLWPATLYPEIYGIPEVLLYLISCAIRLGKEKDNSDHDHTHGASNISAFMSRAKILEKCIKQYHEPKSSASTQAPHSDAASRVKLTHVISAVRNALAIYFYRRVYDVDAAMLQPMVVNVLNSLTNVQCTGADGPTGSLSLVWPGFIAACEAEDPTTQSEFSEWFETCARNSGLDTFAVTIRTIREVWVAKSALGDTGASWIDLAKGKTYTGVRNHAL